MQSFTHKYVSLNSNYWFSIYPKSRKNINSGGVNSSIVYAIVQDI